jgi:hypothetical protein
MYKAWPDCLDASLEEVASLDRQYSRPHKCNECWRSVNQALTQIETHVPLMQIAGNDPYMPNTLRIMTGKGTAYVAPIFPVKVITTLHIAKPQKTIGIVSLAVKPRAITLLTVAARGGANMSEHLTEKRS